MPDRHQIHAGRGAASNPAGRFEPTRSEAEDDGWGILDEPLPKLETQVLPESAKRIIARNNSPDIPFTQSINPYRGCEHACAYCLEGNTPILYADGRHQAIKDVQVGDQIIGTVRHGQFRQYVVTTVLNHWMTVKPAYRITLANGTQLVASGDHRFMTDRGWKYVTGSGSGPNQRPHLTANNRLLGIGGFEEQPDKCADYRRGYLCGMIRGDGHIGFYSYTPRPGRTRDEQHHFRLALTDIAALDRARNYLELMEIQTFEFEFQKAVGDCPSMRAIRTNRRLQVDAIRELIQWPVHRSAQWSKGFLAGIFDAEGHNGGPKGPLRIANTDHSIITAVTAALRMFAIPYCLETVRPESPKPVINVRVKGGLSQKLRFFHLTDPAIARKRTVAGTHLKAQVDLKVVTIEPLGRAERMYDITTGTEDFIANGVLSHNCYARPAHSYVNLSPGLDFETKLFYKKDAQALLTKELAAKNYRCSPIALGSNTDPYQPIERRHRVTRDILELLSDCDHPATIVTKGAVLIERDIDLLASMAQRCLIAVFISITTLDTELKRKLEPRAASPSARLAAVKKLSEAGVPVGVMVAPVIPALTDHELENILEAAAAAGATSAGYIMLRLPYEVRPLFIEWLAAHEPLKANHVMSRVRALREGRDNDAEFGSRQTGTGIYAELFRKRFEVATRKLGLDREDQRFQLDTTRFRPPETSPQRSLF